MWVAHVGRVANKARSNTADYKYAGRYSYDEDTDPSQQRVLEHGTRSKDRLVDVIGSDFPVDCRCGADLNGCKNQQKEGRRGVMSSGCSSPPAEEAMLNPKQLKPRTAETAAGFKSPVAQHERNLREGEARLPTEEQLSLKLRRFIEANVPELAGKLTLQIENESTSASAPRPRS